MSQELEVFVQQNEKRLLKLGRLLDGGIEQSLLRTGAVLRGFTVKSSEYDCLVVVRVVLAGRVQVAFVGGSDFGHCMLKLADMAHRDAVRWKDDKFAEG